MGKDAGFWWERLSLDPWGGQESDAGVVPIPCGGTALASAFPPASCSLEL